MRGPALGELGLPVIKDTEGALGGGSDQLALAAGHGETQAASCHRLNQNRSRDQNKTTAVPIFREPTELLTDYIAF